MEKRGYVAIEGVLSPTGERVTAYLAVSDFNHVAKYIPWKARLLENAQDVLRNPARIFEARRNVGDDEIVGYCYIGRPDRIPDRPSGTRLLAPDELVAVYVDECFTIWEWGVEPGGEDPLTPVHPESRFGERLY